MPYYTNLADVARRTGFPVVEQAGWQSRGHGAMSDVRSIIAHHDAANQSPTTFNWVVQNGTSSLPGPLAQFTLRRDGTIHVVAAGLCYHAGVNNNPGLYSNQYAIGIEAGNNGVGEPWPDRQVDAYVALCGELCKAFGLGADRVRGHKEIAPDRKIDPAGIDMSWFRNRVHQYINGKREETLSKAVVLDAIREYFNTPWHEPTQPGNQPDMSLKGTILHTHQYALEARNTARNAVREAREAQAAAEAAEAAAKEALAEVKREITAVGNEKYKASAVEYARNADHYSYQAQKRIRELEAKVDQLIAKNGG